MEKCRGDKMQNNTNERGELKLEKMNLYNWIELNWSVEVWYKWIHPLTLMGLKESTIKTLEFVTSMERSWHCLWSCTQLVFCWVYIYYIHFSFHFAFSRADGDRKKKINSDITENGVCTGVWGGNGKHVDLRPWDSFKKTDTEQWLCQIDRVIIDYLRPLELRNCLLFGWMWSTVWPLFSHF